MRAPSITYLDRNIHENTLLYLSYSNLIFIQTDLDVINKHTLVLACVSSVWP